MLTSLDFLKPGQPWPPECEQDRLSMYADNRLLFEGKHGDVYKAQMQRIRRVIGNVDDIICFELIFNYQRLITVKVTDLLLGEPPEFTAGTRTGEEAPPQRRQDTVWDIVNASSLVSTLTQAAYDMSRFGDGVLYVYRDEETSKGVVDITQPGAWFPVVRPDNIKRVQYHVLAWSYTEGNGDNEKAFLKCEIHSRGTVERRQYKLDGDTIGALLDSQPAQPTGLTDFAIIPVQNIVTSDRVHGIDDYTDIDSIISELEVRVAQIAKVLDKHSEPSMQGPASALRQNPDTGVWELHTGDYFINQGEHSDKAGRVGYLVWDAQLDANFKIIEKLLNILYTVSEMGSALLGDFSQHVGQIPSGSAMKRLLYSPLAKAQRFRSEMDVKLKQAITLCAQLYGEDMSDAPPVIKWQDGLPGDPAEEADIMSVRTAGKATISQQGAIRALDGSDDEEAEAELERIRENEDALQPIGALATSLDARNADVIDDE